MNWPPDLAEIRFVNSPSFKRRRHSRGISSIHIKATMTGGFRDNVPLFESLNGPRAADISFILAAETTPREGSSSAENVPGSSPTMATADWSKNHRRGSSHRLIEMNPDGRCARALDHAWPPLPRVRVREIGGGVGLVYSMSISHDPLAAGMLMLLSRIHHATCMPPPVLGPMIALHGWRWWTAEQSPRRRAASSRTLRSGAECPMAKQDRAAIIEERSYMLLPCNFFRSSVRKNLADLAACKPWR